MKGCLIAIIYFVVGQCYALPTGPSDAPDLPILIPDTSLLDSDLLHTAGADKFLTLWHINVLSSPVMISDEPWTVLAPLNSGLPKDPSFIIDKEYSRELLLNHVILGDIVSPELAANDPASYYSLADTELSFQKKGETFYVNGIRLTGEKFEYPNGMVFLIEKTIPISQPDYLKYVPAGDLFDSFNSLSTDRKSKQLSDATTAPVETTTTNKPIRKATRFDRFRNTETKDSKTKTTTIAPQTTTEFTTESSAFFFENFFTDADSQVEEFNIAVRERTNETFLESIIAEAELPDSISNEFVHHFLDVGLDQLLSDDKQYTAIIPTDEAFYDYYPIDWGFNPFNVENFTQQVLVNHIFNGKINLHSSQNGTELETLGGLKLLVTRSDTGRIEVNGQPIPPEFDLEVPNGRIYYVGSLFFVNYDRVNNLKEQYPYLETGPLISFPWPTAPFLSHLVKRLQDQSSSTIFEKLLLKSSSAPLVTSSDKDLQRISYTLFMPNEASIRTAFTGEELSFLQGTASPDSIMKKSMIENKKIDKFLLDHIFPGYLFEDDLTSGLVLTSLSGKKAIVTRNGDQIEINGVKVIGSQEYLYNLGGIFMLEGMLSESISKPETVGTTVESSGDVPFPEELIAALKFPSKADPSYRFETRTEVSFSKQINNGEIIPVSKDEADQITNNFL